ncbi:MAG: helix-turn-helix domain-containing protein [Polyangiaceae bacterium]|nr:helix-turn-helix domain-containing protein [Polyangiaceae bacterium]
MTDLALALVHRFAGTATERAVARYMVLEKHPTQARYMMAAHYAGCDPVVARAEAWIRSRMASPFTIADLARGLGTSARTLTRRLQHAVGLAPIRFVQRIRAEQAVHLLQTTTEQLDDIAQRVGYGDASTLRRILRREMQRQPGEIRRA